MSTQKTLKRWYACEACRKVGYYYILPDGNTTFPRGEFLGHRDHIVTDLKSEAAANKWLETRDAGLAAFVDSPREQGGEAT